MKTSRRDILINWLRGGIALSLLGACGWLAWRGRGRDCRGMCQQCRLAKTCDRAQLGASNDQAKP